MASEIGKIVHCKICGAPIEARGNRLYCPVCYNQNRRNAAQRSNARTKMEREQTKREEAKMKENNRIATSAAELNMRAKLSNLGGISYVITPGGQQINYVCVDAFNGHNDVTGYDALQKDDGTVVWGSAELIVYTCLGDAYNVRVACFNRA